MSAELDKNYRRFPFDGGFVLNPISQELHTIGTVAELPGLYAIRLKEAPYKESPSSVVIYNTATSTTMTEVTTTPGNQQYRVDYGENNEGIDTGLVQFHANQNTHGVSVIYKGRGPVLSQANLYARLTAIILSSFGATLSTGRRVRIFTSSGTYTIPPTTTKLLVLGIGGGGGGGGGGTGTSTNGDPGTATSFGAHLSCAGGNFGFAFDTTFQGGAGKGPATHKNGSSDTEFIGSGDDGGGDIADDTGRAGYNFLSEQGSGGAGGTDNGNQRGGGGGAGEQKVKYLSGLTPGASVTVTIGAGGTGGDPGASGGATAGGNGSGGIIIVWPIT